MLTKAYLIYGLIVVGLMGVAEYQGWRLLPVTPTRVAPRSVRDNPGSYRPIYGGFRHIFGGK